MKKTTFTIIGWFVSIALLAILATKMDFAALWEGLCRASWHWLILAALINIGVIFLKALRWMSLTGSMIGNASTWEIFKATVIGMAGNNILPARGGDWFKIYLLGKLQGARKTSLASVAGLDKLFDGLSIVILFGLLSFHSRFPVWVQKGTTIVSILILVALAICVILLVHHRRSSDLSGDETGWLSRIAINFGAGMEALANFRVVAATLANSIAICLLQVATIWCCQLAFGQHLDIWIPALVFVAINLAITIPSAPSGVGPFEAAAVLAFTWFGLTTETAFNIALMYHAIQFFPVTLAGLVFYLGCSAQRTVKTVNSAQCTGYSEKQFTEH